MSTLEDRREKIIAWKKKSWLDFCKEVMIADNRFTLLPLSDYHNASHDTITNGVFGQMCLRRAGTLADIYILPIDPSLGVLIEAGSKYTKLHFTGFPSKAMIYPLVKVSDELERQYIREVTIEATKHNTQLGGVKKGKRYAKSST